MHSGAAYATSFSLAFLSERDFLDERDSTPVAEARDKLNRRYLFGSSGDVISTW